MSGALPSSGKPDGTGHCDQRRSSPLETAEQREPGLSATAGDWSSFVADAVAELAVVVDATGTVVWANRRVDDFLGYPASEWIGRSGLDAVHPDDVPIAAELMVTAQAMGYGIKEPVTYRFRGSDGSWVELEVVATHVERYDERFLVLTGRPAQRRPSAPIVDEVAQRLSQAFDEAAIGMAQVDLDGRIMRANERLAHKLGASVEELARKRLPEIIAVDDADEFRRRWLQLIERQTPRLSIEVRLPTETSEVHGHVTGSIVHDRFGQPMYVAVQVVNVTERVIAERALLVAQRELVHRSNHDPLTGLGNRQLLTARMNELSGDGDGHGVVGVLYMDLDGFKAVNDSYGHMVGDELLIEIASRLRDKTRPGDSVVRLGGDEFVIIAKFSSTDEASSLADRLLEALQEPFDLGTSTVSVGCSIGVAVAPLSATGFDSLVDAADRALYAAKRAGRNCYRIAPV